MKKEIKIGKIYFCQTSKRNKNNPFEVVVLSIKGNLAEVKTIADYPQIFKVKISSLFN